MEIIHVAMVTCLWKQTFCSLMPTEEKPSRNLLFKVILGVTVLSERPISKWVFVMVIFTGRMRL